MIAFPTSQRVLVEVTESDIREGMPGSCAGCPLAIAIARAVDRSGVTISGHWIMIVDQEVRIWSMPTPTTLWMFMRQFDRGDEVSPFQFTLDLEQMELWSS